MSGSGGSCKDPCTSGSKRDVVVASMPTVMGMGMTVWRPCLRRRRRYLPCAGSAGALGNLERMGFPPSCFAGAITSGWVGVWRESGVACQRWLEQGGCQLVKGLISRRAAPRTNIGKPAGRHRGSSAWAARTWCGGDKLAMPLSYGYGSQMAAPSCFLQQRQGSLHPGRTHHSCILRTSALSPQ